MSQWHGYIGIENLALNAAQREILIAELRRLGPASDPQPAQLCHWKTRLDNQAAIFETLFQQSNLTVDKFRERLATIFSVDPGTIQDDTQTATFDTRPTPIVTFSRAGTDYLRFAAFGGTAATWSQSGDEARAYLAANRDQWEPEDP